jgi:hypothetical protein
MRRAWMVGMAVVVALVAPDVLAQKKPPPKLPAGYRFQQSEFDQDVVARGPVVQQGAVRFELIAMVDKYNGHDQQRLFLQVARQQGDREARFNEAVTDTTRKLDVLRELGRVRPCLPEEKCARVETAVVSLYGNVLWARVSDGMRTRVRGEGGEVIVALDPKVIDAHVRAAEAVKAWVGR